MAASLITDWWHPSGLAGLQTTLSAAVSLLIDPSPSAVGANDDDNDDDEEDVAGVISANRVTTLFFVIYAEDAVEKRLRFGKWIDSPRFC